MNISRTRSVRAVAVCASILMVSATAAPALAAPGDDTPVCAAGVAEEFCPVASVVGMPDSADLVITKTTPISEETAKANDFDLKQDGRYKDFVGGAEAGAHLVGGITFTAYRLGTKDAAYDLSSANPDRNGTLRHAASAATRLSDMTVAERETAISNGSFEVPKLGTTPAFTAYLWNGDGSSLKGAGGDKPLEATTGKDGRAVFKDLPAGLYVVQEKDFDRESVTLTNPENGQSRTLAETENLFGTVPVAVLVPMTDQGDTSTWLKRVFIYPKNSVAGTEKNVYDAETPGTGNPGDADVSRTATPPFYNYSGEESTLRYTVDSGIPENQAPFSMFMMVDQLDEHLDYVIGSSEVYILYTEPNDPATPWTATGQGLKLEEGAANDYTLHTPQEKVDNRQVLTIQLTEKGRQKLAEKNAGRTPLYVRWIFGVKVGDTTGYTEIPNQAKTLINRKHDCWNPDKPTPEIPGIPTNKVVSKYWGVKITKVDKTTGDEPADGAEDTRKKLKGAKFKLYQCNDKGQFLDRKYRIVKNKKDAPAVVVRGVDEWTTGEDGTVTIDGLQVNDFKNNSETVTKKDALATGRTDGNGWSDSGENNTADDSPFGATWSPDTRWSDISSYCLVETEAPADYELLPEPVRFQLLSTDKPADESLAKLKDITVADVPGNAGFNLPLTGGRGVVPLLALGGLLIVTAGYMAARGNRRSHI